MTKEEKEKMLSVLEAEKENAQEKINSGKKSKVRWDLLLKSIEEKRRIISGEEIFIKG